MHRSAQELLLLKLLFYKDFFHCTIAHFDDVDTILRRSDDSAVDSIAGDLGDGVTLNDLNLRWVATADAEGGRNHLFLRIA